MKIDMAVNLLFTFPGSANMRKVYFGLKRTFKCSFSIFALYCITLLFCSLALVTFPYDLLAICFEDFCGLILTSSGTSRENKLQKFDRGKKRFCWTEGRLNTRQSIQLCSVVITMAKN